MVTTPFAADGATVDDGMTRWIAGDEICH